LGTPHFRRRDHLHGAGSLCDKSRRRANTSGEFHVYLAPFPSSVLRWERVLPCVPNSDLSGKVARLVELDNRFFER
jgi:hypothetical protein